MLLDDLEKNAHAAPANAGLIYRGARVPYRALHEQAVALAAGLMARGIGPGSIVGVLSPNGPDVFALLFGLFGAGAVAVPIQPAVPGGELEWIARKTGLTHLFADQRAAKAVAAASAALLPEHPVALFEFAHGTPGALDAFKGRGAPRLPEADLDRPAVYLFSSGSTGRPKMVPHSHRTMAGNAAGNVRSTRTTPDDVAFNALPPSHSFGLSQMIAEMPYGGATTLIWDDPRPLTLARNKMVETLAAEKVTIMPGVPFVFDTLSGATTAAMAGHLRLCHSAGTKLPRAVFDKFVARFGVPLRQSIGSSETSQFAINMAPDNEVAAIWDSVGMLTGDAEAEIMPSPLVPEGQGGELFIRTPGLSPGYIGADAASMAQFRDGGFAIGDLARFDDAGNLFILGRAKLIYDISGEKVDPVEIEDVLAAYPGVAEAVVVAVPHPRTGDNRLKAALVADTSLVTEAELRQHCRNRLATYKVPDLFAFLDEIPKSATGKVLRGKLID